MQPESRSALETVLHLARLLAARGESIGDLTAFTVDEDQRAVVERHFITIGEALARVARRDPGLFSEIPAGREIVDFRNVLVHGYDAIDTRVVWDALIRETGPLAEVIERLLRSPEEPVDTGGS